jgi:hypothetical protein
MDRPPGNPEPPLEEIRRNLNFLLPSFLKYGQLDQVPEKTGFLPG